MKNENIAPGSDSPGSDERAYWVTLSQTPGVGPKRFFELLRKFGSARAVWEARSEDFANNGVTDFLRKLILKRRKVVHPQTHLEVLIKQGIEILTLNEENYPKELKNIQNAPPVLFVRGSLSENDNKAIAVVGTRKPTAYGREVTEKIVRELVDAGFTIISGLARGVDGIAHRTVLAAGGRTVGFLGGGIDNVYPSEHRGLAINMERQGAVISEFGPGFQPSRGNFPARNRLISGMSLGVLVVEGLSKSGTKHTADHARAQNKPVFAIPGPITSRMSDAPMDLLMEGAVMVRSGKDIVRHLEQNGVDFGNGKSPQETSLKWKFENDLEELLYMLLELEPMEGNLLIKKSQMDPSEVLTTLSMMELKGMVRNMSGEYRICQKN